MGVQLFRLSTTPPDTRACTIRGTNERKSERFVVLPDRAKDKTVQVGIVPQG